MLSELLLAQLSRLSRPGRPGSAPLPLNRQLYEALRHALLHGHLSAGERLPSSRDLAHDLGLSRNTVMAAIGQLSVEGYLSSHVGSGTFVADSVPLVGAAQRASAPQANGVRPVPTAWAGSAPRHALSRRGAALAQQFTANALEVQPFTPGMADFSAFPIGLWQRLQNKHWRNARPDMLDYNNCGGHGPLRRAVADYVRVFRSVHLEPEQVIITSGTQQSLALCAQLLADPGDTVWLEDPAYWGATKAFTAASLTLHAVPVDGEGIHPGPADHDHPPSLVYVTPSHQYPSGAVMSLARRQALLEAARRHGAWVLEDDYDSEFRFSGPPMSSLQGLDADGRVLYMGTFSKVLYPGIKLGYLVVPKHLAADFKQAHYDLHRPGQMPLQAALAEFIEMGHFASALRRARVAYAQRRHALVQALRPCLQAPPPATGAPATHGHAQAHDHPPTDPTPAPLRPLAWIAGAEQGLHLCLRLPPGVDDRALAQEAARHHLTVRPLSAYCLARTDLQGLMIGYGYASLAAIEQHSPTLCRLLREALDAQSPRIALPAAPLHPGAG